MLKNIGIVIFNKTIFASKSSDILGNAKMIYFGGKNIGFWWVYRANEIRSPPDHSDTHLLGHVGENQPPFGFTF